MGFGSSLTPEINIDCNFGDILKFPLIGSFFNTLVYSIVTPLLLVMFLIPLLITVYMSVYSCKTITFDAFANHRMIMDKINDNKGVIIFILAIMTLHQLHLSYQEDESFFSVLGILLFVIIIFIHWSRSGVKQVTATVVTETTNNPLAISRPAIAKNAFENAKAQHAIPLEKTNSHPKRSIKRI